MESRIRHIFHRKKDQEEQSPAVFSQISGSQPSLSQVVQHQLRYKDAQPGPAPEVGIYPKGASKTAPTFFSRHQKPQSHTSQDHTPLPALPTGRFAQMSLDHGNGSKPLLSFAAKMAPREPANRGSPRRFSHQESYGRQNQERPDERVSMDDGLPSREENSASSQARNRQTSPSRPIDSRDTDILSSNASSPSTPGRNSIRRNRVGSGAADLPPTQTSSRSPALKAHHAFTKRLRPPPNSRTTSEDPGKESNQPAATTSIRSAPAADEILERSTYNSSDTEVVKRTVPAVVHETVHRDIHHVKEEVITREVHTHDDFHRIQPIIDVEVLPARHFLPVHGGGLVEVPPEAVPGRARYWVIAETLSTIPSHEPESSLPPKGPPRFTAREFPGTEGDDREYVTADGVPRTERTWVHPPELETGAKRTGETWPLEVNTR